MMEHQRVEVGGDDLNCHMSTDVVGDGLIRRYRARKSELSGIRGRYGSHTRSPDLCPIDLNHLPAGSLEEKPTSRQVDLTGSGVLEDNSAIDVLWSWYWSPP